MEIHSNRIHLNDVCSIGELSVEGDDFTCYTLEDKDRKLSSDDTVEHIKEIKVYGRTAIPYGRYEIIISYSNRFKKELPLLLGVKGFDGIRIHPLNEASETDGCVGVGLQKDVVNNKILQSRAAFAILFQLIKDKIRTEKVFITIGNINALPTQA